MTKDEFMNKYMHYAVSDYNSAFSDSVKVNQSAEGFTVEPVEVDGEYCLMLSDAANFARQIGII